jgi:hypothetical protein
MNTFTNSKDMETLTVEVSQVLDNKYLKDFVKSSILLNDKEFSKEDNLYALFIEELSSYEILIVNSKYKYLIFEIFKLNYLKDKKKIDLYLCDGFFCIYKNSNLYYVQNIDSSVNNEDLIDYVSKKLNIRIDNFMKYSNTELEKLKKEFLLKNIKSDLINLNENKNHSFKIYLFYLFTLFFATYYLLSIEKVSKPIETIDINKLKEKYSYKYFDDEFLVLIDKIRRYKLKLKQLDYKNKKLNIVLTSHKKDDIYSFLGEYKNRLLQNNINYLEIEKIYECTLDVKQNR